MSYEVQLERGYAVVYLEGEIDMYQSPEARGAILNCLGNGHHTLVEMSAIRYIDSSGVASLVEGLQTARERDLRFALVGVSEAAMRVLQLARLDGVFTIHPSVDRAPEVK